MSIVDSKPFCFPDSDIWIVSQPDEEKTRYRFKVHKHVLQLSPVFNDMFTLGQGHESDNIPVLEVEDRPDDLTDMFCKLYEHYKQYGTTVGDPTMYEPVPLARLAIILDKYSFEADSTEIKAILDRQLEVDFGDLGLYGSVRMLPYLARLNHEEIQDKVVSEIGVGLDTSTKHSMEEVLDAIAEIDASSISVDVYEQVIRRCSSRLVQRQTKWHKLQEGKEALHAYLRLLSLPLSEGVGHHRLACWVGTTSPAWQEGIRQVFKGLWRHELDLDRKPVQGFLFDKGKNKERAKALLPLESVLTIAHQPNGCAECAILVRGDVNCITTRYLSWTAMALSDTAPCPQPLEPRDIESDSATPVVITSDLFDLEDAELRILSRKDGRGHRMSYHLHKRLADASPVLRSMLPTQDNNIRQAVDHQIIELDETPQYINALLRVLYSYAPSEFPYPDALRMSEETAEPFALGYIMLKKLQFEKYIGETRGVLRQMLLSCPSTHWSSEVLVALLQFADEEKDHALRQTILKCFESAIGKPFWDDKLRWLPHILEDLSRTSLKDLLVILVKSYIAESKQIVDIQGHIAQIAHYVSALCSELEIPDDHSLYACYKLSSLPAWSTAQSNAMNLFCQKLQFVTSDAAARPLTAANFSDFYSEMIVPLEGLVTSTCCEICRKAVDEWVKAVKTAFSAQEMTRKRKRALEDEGNRSADTARAV